MATEKKDGIVFEYPDDDEIPGTTGNKVTDEQEVENQKLYEQYLQQTHVLPK